MCVEIKFERIKTVVDSKEKRWSAMINLVIALIIVTPLCGLLFQCGCDWPWAGLDAGCNFYKASAEHQCPWCASLSTGILSTGAAVVAGILVSTAPFSLINKSSRYESVVRTLLGVSVFVLAATVSAAAAAFWQDYPLGIGAILMGFAWALPILP